MSAVMNGGEARWSGRDAANGDLLPGGASAAPMLVDSWAERFLDRLNPVVVRALRQTARSRGFVVAMGLALVGEAVLSLVLATGAESWTLGEPFVWSLQALVLATSVVVPFHVQGALGKEVESDLSEHVLLTRLTPGRIVNGHFTVALLQVLILVSLFSPLLATTYLLRGVDVPTVLLGLGYAITVAFAISTSAAAAGSLGRVKAGRALGRAVGGVVVVTAAFSATSALTTVHFFGLSALGDPWLAIGSWLGVLALWVWLMRLVATAMLSHPFDNRSTGFRVFGLVTSAVCLAWATAAPPAMVVGQVVPATAAALTAGAAILWIFAATEDEALSPLVRARSPRTRGLALLLAPLYPGGARGILLAVIHGGALVAAAVLLPTLIGEVADGTGVEAVGLAVAYAVGYAALGRLIRQRMGPGSVRNWIARALVLVVLGLASILPGVVVLFAGGGMGKNPGYLLSPLLAFATYELGDALWPVAIGAGVLVALCLPSMARGLHEMQVATQDARFAPGE